MKRIRGLLTDYFCDSYNIDDDFEFVIETINARELIVPERIDLVAKYKYVEFYEKGYKVNFIKELYKAHVEAFTMGKYEEPGNKKKNSIDIFFQDFHETIESIKSCGFDETISVIPVGKSNAILDGAHRVAIAAYFNMDISIIRFEHIGVQYDINFFKRRLLDEKYLNYLITQYTKIKNNVYVACIWPKASNRESRDLADKLINKSTKVISKHNTVLNYQGLKNLMSQIYSHQDWIGTYENNFKGVDNKAIKCYEKGAPLLLYTFECESLIKVLELKEKVRDIFKIENHSIHITDNSEESYQLTSLLLNRNSIEYLNVGQPCKYTSFVTKLKNLKEQLNTFKLDNENLVIDSSSVMALYGLRNAEDIDYLSIDESFNKLNSNVVGNHNEYIKFYGDNLENIIFDPTNFFIYNDLKFTKLELVKQFKINRNENKDKLDIDLINSITHNERKLRIVAINIIFKVRLFHRNTSYVFKQIFFKTLKKINCYNFFRSIYRNLKGIRRE
ncbi:hypothetical protein [Inediibacterium massiliense]|uniref:hypothetical protein n=1 Tax=Inediibacterium massiliense TaxID=1658111 RepID=UPI0006B5AD00|nr:hypothetical protein [Inediibacterium massiliense]